MSISLVSLIVGLITAGLQSAPADIAAIQALLAKHAQESPAEAAAITVALGQNINTLTRTTDAALDAVKLP